MSKVFQVLDQHIKEIQDRLSSTHLKKEFLLGKKQGLLNLKSELEELENEAIEQEAAENESKT